MVLVSLRKSKGKLEWDIHMSRREGLEIYIELAKSIFPEDTKVYPLEIMLVYNMLLRDKGSNVTMEDVQVALFGLEAALRTDEEDV